MSDKLHLRLLGLFVAMLGVAQIGWGVYFLTPAAKRRPEPRPKNFVFRELAAPRFKYRLREMTEDRQDAGWREVAIPVETGGKILKLLGGSRTEFATLDEYFLKFPDQQIRYRHSYPELLGRLEVYEQGSESPSLWVDFLQSRMFMVSRPRGTSEIYFARPENWAELDDVTAAIREDREL